MAKAESKRTAKAARPTKREPRPRTPSSASDAALCLLLLLRGVYRRMRENRRMIEALTQIDPATGVFKPHAAASGCAPR